MARPKVNLEVLKGRLRLRWTYLGKRVVLALGLDDSAPGRAIAEGKAAIIAGDLASGEYDPTLARYKSNGKVCPQKDEGSTSHLFERFYTHRCKAIGTNSRTKYEALTGHIAVFFDPRDASEVSDNYADEFRQYLISKVSLSTVASYISLLKGCWAWGTKRGLVSGQNPWVEVSGRIKVPHTRKAMPFSRDEVQAILRGFRSNRHYAHYGDFVMFLFGTGCRLGEAVALQWQHLEADCSKVWIGEAVSKGKRGPTKTNTSREFRLSPKQQQMLLARKPDRAKPDDLVFPSPKSGGPIDIRNFRNRAWQKVLKAANVPYRRPYLCRSTFISHALETGEKPMTIAQITGHDPETLFKFYASSLSNCNQIPDVL
jgi:integrase